MQRATTILTAIILILGVMGAGCSKKGKGGACVDVGGAACQECRNKARALVRAAEEAVRFAQRSKRGNR